MASIGGLSSSTSSSIGSTSLRGYGGLASGLDRDTLIENMTYGTTSKITQQQQKKQQLEWKQEAVRSISDKMIAFGNKYTSTITASTNLFNSNFWGRSVITGSGENSKYVALSGTAGSANAITISAVKQLAQKATVSSSKAVSDQKLATGTLNVEDDFTTQNLAGKTINFTVGSKSYSIYLGDKAGDDKLEYDTAEHVAEAISKLLEKEEEGLSQKVTFTGTADGKISLTGSGGNAIYLTGGSALQYLGMTADKDKENNLNGKTVEGALTGHTTTVGFKDMINGKTLTFNYNGTSKSIKLTGTDDLEVLQKDLQAKLDEAFGKGRVKVNLNGEEATKKKTGTFEFQTLDPETGGADDSSSLTLTSGSSGLLGGAESVFKVSSGASNRMSLDSKIADLSAAADGKWAALNGKKEIYVVDGKLTLSKAGAPADAEIKTIGISDDETVRSLMQKINENTDMTVSYQSAADKFVFTSKENGASGHIQMDAALAKMFGLSDGTKEVDVRGKDAQVAVKYAGSDEEVLIRRDSNTFNLEGLTVALKGTFGYKEVKDADGNVVKDAKGNVMLERDMTAEAISVTASVDTDKVVDNIKSMIEEYNAIVEEVNSQLSTKHDKDYTPLTTEQRNQLSETEIKNYEEKAKEGLLFGDSDLRMLSSALRTVMSGGLQEEFRKIGITTSSSYSDNGKLELDETKLRSALATDPENVERLFTSTAGTNADGTATYNGLATNLKSVIYQYSNPLGSSQSKGVLVRKAGTQSSVLSLTDNEMYNEIKQLDKLIANLQERLQTERDRYISQFTSLETLISQMNAQSGWLSSFS
ncbi:MAG TPA: hypothetical protein DF613_07340 [Lachnospiraceae bacterium]|nr:hypothetical protein [Lachnospiraceae bacterium]